MGRAAKTYVYGVIAAGGLVLAYALTSWRPAELWVWAIYLVLSVLAPS
jgi:hypothetical protein